MEELNSDVLLWIPKHGRAIVGQLAKTYLHQLIADTRCSMEKQSGAVLGTNGEWESGISVLSGALN